MVPFTDKREVCYAVIPRIITTLKKSNELKLIISQLNEEISVMKDNMEIITTKITSLPMFTVSEKNKILERDFRKIQSDTRKYKELYENCKSELRRERRNNSNLNEMVEILERHKQKNNIGKAVLNSPHSHKSLKKKIKVKSC